VVHANCSALAKNGFLDAPALMMRPTFTRSVLQRSNGGASARLMRAASSSTTLKGVNSRLVRGRQIHADGRVEDKEASSRELIDTFGLLPRDLRLLATRGSNLAVRPNYFLFRFPPLAGVVSSESVLLVDNFHTDQDQDSLSAGGQPNADSSATLVQLASGVLERVILRALERTDINTIPFEQRVLEVVLREDLVRKLETFTVISQQVTLALDVRSYDRPANRADLTSAFTSALGADRHSREREHALYRLLTLSESLDSLQVQVRRSEACLDAIMRSDEDMAMLYLSHRRSVGIGRALDKHEEVEMLLEGYGTQLIDLDDRIVALQSRVKANQTLEDLKLRNERNRIMRVELLVSFSGISLTFATVVVGLFGMNLHSGIEEVHGLLWPVAGGSVVASFAIYSSLRGAVSRYYELQRTYMQQRDHLQRALRSLDVAYYALRQTGALSVGHSAAGTPGLTQGHAIGTVSEEALAYAVQATATRGQVDAHSFKEALTLFDVNSDGNLSVDEMKATRSRLGNHD
jgi:Mg2+ and Co2+ transporter CorA